MRAITWRRRGRQGLCTIREGKAMGLTFCASVLPDLTPEFGEMDFDWLLQGRIESLVAESCWCSRDPLWYWDKSSTLAWVKLDVGCLGYMRSFWASGGFLRLRARGCRWLLLLASVTFWQGVKIKYWKRVQKCALFRAVDRAMEESPSNQRAK